MNVREDTLSRCCSSLYELPLTALLLGDSFHPGGIALTKRLAEMAFVGPDDRVLDVACGTGMTAHALTQEFGAKVVGIDYSASLIDRANQHGISPDYRCRPRFCQASVLRLPIQSASQDIVFCECALCTFPDPMLALVEFFRVLRPGGRLAISDITIDKPVPASLQNILSHNICVAGAKSVNQYQSMIAKTGFANIRAQTTDHVLLEMLERIERQLQLGEVILEMQRLKLPEQGPETRQTLVEAREFLSSGGAGYALITARKPGKLSPG